MDSPLPSEGTALSLGAEHVPHLSLDTGGRSDSIALSPKRGCPAAGAFTSRSGTGEGSLARINRATQKSKRKRQIAKVAIARTFDF